MCLYMIWPLLPVWSHLSPLSSSFTTLQQYWPFSFFTIPSWFHTETLTLAVSLPNSLFAQSFNWLHLSQTSTQIPLLREVSIATIGELPCLFVFIILTSGCNYFMYLFVGLFACLLTVSFCWNRASVVNCYAEILILQLSRLLGWPYISLATECTQVFIPVYYIKNIN